MDIYCCPYPEKETNLCYRVETFGDDLCPSGVMVNVVYQSLDFDIEPVQYIFEKEGRNKEMFEIQRILG